MEFTLTCPTISSMYGVNLERKMLDKMLCVIGNSDIYL